jgi:hypothetical protein
MTARGTYDHICHCYRMFARAVEMGDLRLSQCMVKLLSTWNVDEPKIANAAREAQSSREAE